MKKNTLYIEKLEADKSRSRSEGVPVQVRRGARGCREVEGGGERVGGGDRGRG